MAKITCYTDCVSPYAYFAFETIESYRKIWNVDIEFQPVSLGIIMKESGNRPPISVPNKGKWLQKDVARTCEQMQLKNFGQPAEFPYNSLKAQRILQAVQMGESEANFIECLRSFWRAGWVDHLKMTDAEVLAKTLARTLSMDKAREYVAKGETKEVKDRLMATTKYLLEEGAFGLPYVCAEKDGKKEWFWGNDRWDHITAFLGLEWQGMKPCQQSSAKL